MIIFPFLGSVGNAPFIRFSLVNSLVRESLKVNESFQMQE